MQNKVKENTTIYDLSKRVNKLIIKQILEDILNKKIINFNILSIEKFKHIPEYNFKLLKLEVILENEIKHDVFLKIINKNKIQETIFCYWYFCEEKYGINARRKEKHYTKQATITEYKKQYYRKKFNIKFLSKYYKIHNSSNIYFIDMEKYISQLNNKEKGTFLGNVSQKDEVIFLGII